MLTAVVGINWGDEGKGRMVDLLSEKFDIVMRYQGGKGELRKNVFVLRRSYLDAGSRYVPESLDEEDDVYGADEKIVEEEKRLADKKFGSTRRGIAPVYADKYMKKTLRMGDLRHPELLFDKLRDIVEWKNLTVSGGYKHEAVSAEEIYDWLMQYGMRFLPYVKNTTEYLTEAVRSGKSLMFEAQLGALRDIDFGIYPYTSSSSTIAAYAPIGAGIPAERLDNVVGIMKAYSSCVGEGPFTCELFGDEAHELREAGGEYGAATGRPRRVGGFDVPASKYGVLVQGANELALTKLDVLSYLDKIPVCVAYDIDGERTDKFPSGPELDAAKPVYEYLPGWKCDISKARSFSELPKETQDYVLFIEKAVGSKIKYVSVGAGRDEYFEM